jgi:hypothetical protein
MTAKNIIFMGGFCDKDNYEMEQKGWRGDVLVQDEENNYYELTFITVERLIIDLNNNKQVYNKKYFSEEWGWVVVEKLNFDVIYQTIISLGESGYFDTQKPKIEIDAEDIWSIFEI